MASNKEKMQANYKDAVHEDERFLRDKASMMESHYTKKFLSKYISLDNSVIELGCGTGHYGLFLADKCKSYLGIDISLDNIEMFKTKIAHNSLTNVKAQAGDATNLTSIDDKAYDVVLVLGPMYHLPPEEREMVFEESKRICKENGIIIYAYINKVGAYLTGCFLAPDAYPSKKANEFVLDKGKDDIHPDLFFLTMPEEIERIAKSHGISVLENVGIDFAFNTNIINAMSEEQLDAWMTLSDFMSTSRSCTGVSNHALLICKNSYV
ncbi:MAG: class I SAM-dependent methyltransferase [Bacillota bacterium]|nr:class I SAM-dependent methyltransferase [Bacillota bacterium]